MILYAALSLASTEVEALILDQLRAGHINLVGWPSLLASRTELEREPAGDIDTAVVDSLKVLGPNRPISAC